LWPAASWNPLSAWHARQSVWAASLPGNMAINSKTMQPVQNARDTLFRDPWPLQSTAPELLRMFRFVRPCCSVAHRAVEEAVHAALLILAFPSSGDRSLAGLSRYPYGEVASYGVRSYDGAWAGIIAVIGVTTDARKMQVFHCVAIALHHIYRPIFPFRTRKYALHHVTGNALQPSLCP